MRVVVATNMYPVPDRPWYGVFVKEQVEDLRALGLDVAVVFLNGRASKASYLRGIAAVARVARDADLVHAHYGLTGAVAGVQRRTPTVTTFHGSDCNGDVPWQTAVSWCVARATTPIFVSSELSRGLGLPEAAVIPAAVDTDVFRPVDRAAARARLGWSADEIAVLLPGSRAVARKRADLFDAAVDHASRTLGAMRTASLEGIGRDEVATLMNAVDAVVMTSNHEGSPVAVKEALACTTPVVSVPVGDVDETLAGLPGCAVVERDPRALGEALVAACAAGRDPALRERALPFSRPRIARMVADVYEEVLGR